MSLATNIAEARKRAGLTQEQLAERLGRNRAVVWEWETGRRAPRIPMLDRIAAITGVTTVELHTGLNPTNDTGTDEPAAS